MTDVAKLAGEIEAGLGGGGQTGEGLRVRAECHAEGWGPDRGLGDRAVGWLGRLGLRVDRERRGGNEKQR